jgi:RsiW-degrading membrane proteinase PrsW (M82 family)
MARRGVWWQVLMGVASIAIFGWFAAETPTAVLLPALAPVAGYSLLLLLLTRYRREAGYVLLATLTCGAVVASGLALAANDLAQLRLASVVGDEHARVLTPTIAAPILEELCKALMLLVVLAVRRDSRNPTLDGIVYGALVGLGFAVVENINYFTLAAVQGGSVGLARSVYLRALLGGLNHAMFTGMVGAGIGYMTEATSARRGFAALGAGFFGAITEHVVWNAWASRAITHVLCNASQPGGPCSPAPEYRDLFGHVPVIVAASVLPGLALLCFLTRWAIVAEHREGRL